MELKEITDQNVWKICKLRVRDDQDNFVATNTQSLIEAFLNLKEGKPALPFGLYEGEELVGFVMFGYDSIDAEDPTVARGNYCLWRLMIEESKQGRGLGKAAMEASLRYLETKPCGNADFVWLSYEPENTVARDLYHQFGFIENGEMCDDEIVAVRKL